ncbi:MAG: type II toxin-antitoxin system HicB family antitoxin [Pyramidobacter sp.]
MKLAYPACFYPCEETKGAYTVVVPDLPGCVTQGKDLADAIFMAQDAASGWLLDELEDGKAAPLASRHEDVKADEYENGFVSMLALDMDAYAKKHGKKSDS